ncbi:hypothetical protein [Flectobacillus major]|uniref:hypothetical protein n=1 Tax=Flectobacillus major TaxID=103 RepID=UPI00040E3220|nr:hypothetical protein [Flectobacillus major]
MNTQEYIESGILEAYLLGLVSDAEQKEVDKNLRDFPEIYVAVKELENTINDHFSTHAVPPPPAVRSRVQFKEEKQEVKKWHFTDQGETTQKPKEEQSYLEIEVNNTHINVHKYWRPAFIAVFILSKIFLILAVYFYFKADTLDKENARLTKEIEAKYKNK